MQRTTCPKGLSQQRCLSERHSTQVPYGHARLRQLKGQESYRTRNEIKNQRWSTAASSIQVPSASLPTPTGWGGSVETAWVPYQALSAGGATEAARCKPGPSADTGSITQLLLMQRNPVFRSHTSPSLGDTSSRKGRAHLLSPVTLPHCDRGFPHSYLPSVPHPSGDSSPQSYSNSW